MRTQIAGSGTGKSESENQTGCGTLAQGKRAILSRFGLSALLASLVLSGCVQHEGTVIKKEYKPLQCYVRSESLILVGGGSIIRGQIPVLYYDTEYYRIDIQRKDGAVETYYLKDKPLFEALKPGDFYKLDPKTAGTSYRLIRLRLEEHEFAKVVSAEGDVSVVATTLPASGPASGPTTMAAAQ